MENFNILYFMENTIFTIKGDYIELIKLLKATGITDSGGEAKTMVDEKLVKVNGALELRKRAKLKKGDVVTTATHSITIA